MEQMKNKKYNKQVEGNEMFRTKLFADVKKNKITYGLTYEGLMFHVEHYWKKLILITISYMIYIIE